MSKTLDEAIKEANIERAQRFPLLDITENIKEIREIAQLAIPYVREMNSDLCEPEPWEFVAQSVMQVLTATFEYLNQRKSTEFREVYIPLGTLMTVAIEYGETKSGDKAGTFNPCIRVGKDMSYEFREESYNDSMSADMANDLKEIGMEYLHPMFYDTRKEMHEIFDKAAANLMAKYGVKVPDTESLSYILVAFFRKAKEYFIAHKDDDDGYGVEVNLGRLITMGIEKQADGDYFIYVSPGQEFKMEHAKGDNKTELGE